MGHLSYKAFSTPIFNQCGTPTPHLLFSTISTSSVSFFHIIMLPRSGRYPPLAPPLEGVNGTHRLAFPPGRFRHKEPLPWLLTISFDTTCWETGEHMIELGPGAKPMGRGDKLSRELDTTSYPKP